jgi:hypothetical protein
VRQLCRGEAGVTTANDVASPDAFVGSLFPGAKITCVSRSNNIAYVVETGGEVVTVKVMTDPDIPTDYLLEVNQAIARTCRTPLVHSVHRKAAGAAYDCVVLEYIEGENVAAILENSPALLHAPAFVEALSNVIEALAELRPHAAGYGLYKSDGRMFEQHADFISFYVDRYVGRVLPAVSKALAERIGRWRDGVVSFAGGPQESSRVVPVDMNLRNFIQTSSGDIVVLNVPIVARSRAEHAFGACSAHLAGTALRDELIATATRRMTCSIEARAIAHYELFTLLGILSFYAKRCAPAPIDPMTRNWGSRMGILEQLELLLSSYEAGRL